MSYINRSFATGSHSINGRDTLSDDQLRRLAPSIFAAERHESRSERYSYIPTSEVVAGMRENGFVPVSAKQGNSRIEGKENFTKHLVRFRPVDETVVARQIGGLYPEVIIVNSHDGTSSYKVMAGLLRLVCLNGMVKSDRSLANINIPHKGNIVDRVIEGSFTVINESRAAIETAKNWAGVTLSGDEQTVMAEAVHSLRFEADDEGRPTTAIKPAQLLRARRREDVGSSLWNVTNVLQENMIRGGLSAMGRDANNRPRLSTMREVKGIDADVKLNRALWMLSERMAELKNAA
jgi:hypothetical protein